MGHFTFSRSVLALACGAIFWVGASAQAAVVPVTENFNGTESSSGLVLNGFNASGWTLTSNPAGATTIDTSAGTLAVAGTSLPGASLTRTIGAGAFVKDLVLSDISMWPSGNSNVVVFRALDEELTQGPPSGGNAVGLQLNFQGTVNEYRLQLLRNSDNVIGISHGDILLGTDLSAGLTLRLVHDGADKWDGYVKVGSGAFQLVGSIDGEYEFVPTAGRVSRVSIHVPTHDSNARTVSLNQYTLVPEPSSLALLGLGGLMLLRRRR